MAHPVVVDGRNLLDPEAMADLGFWYYPTGRPAVAPEATTVAAIDEADRAVAGPAVARRRTER
jgi:hypothetical protein